MIFARIGRQVPPVLKEPDSGSLRGCDCEASQWLASTIWLKVGFLAIMEGFAALLWPRGEEINTT
jgi:hypothetical protein